MSSSLVFSRVLYSLIFSFPCSALWTIVFLIIFQLKCYATSKLLQNIFILFVWQHKLKQGHRLCYRCWFSTWAILQLYHYLQTYWSYKDWTDITYWLVVVWNLSTWGGYLVAHPDKGCYGLWLEFNEHSDTQAIKPHIWVSHQTPTSGCCRQSGRWILITSHNTTHLSEPPDTHLRVLLSEWSLNSNHKP
jgi:hypothetical protein